VSFDKNDIDSSPDGNSNLGQSLNNISSNSTNSKTTSVEIEEIDHNFSTMLSNAFLIEYMYYIIKGILEIGKEISNKKTPYMIK
jgi:hypothetical protein